MQNLCTRIHSKESGKWKLNQPKWMINSSLGKVLLSEKALKKVNTPIHKIHHFSCLIDTTPAGKDELKRQTLVSSTVIFLLRKKPSIKTNCTSQLQKRIAETKGFKFCMVKWLPVKTYQLLCEVELNKTWTKLILWHFVTFYVYQFKSFAL